MNSILLFFGVLILLFAVFVFVPARTLANAIKTALPGGLILLGAALALLGRAGLGSLFLFAGLALWRRLRGVGSFGPGPLGRDKNSQSQVRAAAIEMNLDHDSGDMQGVVLAGQFEGSSLSDLEPEDLMTFRGEIQNDADSTALLDAYLDRRIPGWREDAQFDAGPGEGSASRSGPMSPEEAYQVLGLSADASAEDIRLAHRRLMKGLHPDSGGSTFLATKINEAKDVLLRSHS